MKARTTSVTAATALVTALTLGGCGGAEEASDAAAAAEQTTTAQTPTGSGTTAGTPDAERIPDGTYRRVVTEVDFDAAGLPEELREEFLGSDGEMPTAYEFDGDRYTHYVTNDAGVEEVGDLGTVDYDDQGRLVTTSQSTGCPGCVGTLEWSFDGQVLDMITPPEFDPVDAFVVGGQYTRDG